MTAVSSEPRPVRVTVVHAPACHFCEDAFATLDQLSKGRFDFGVGRGFIRDEFDAFGVPMKESRERVEEGVELVKAAWAGGPLEFTSKFRPPMKEMPSVSPVLMTGLAPVP